MTPHDFRAPFTAAEGWGTIAQKREGRQQHQSVEVRWGTLRLKTLAFEVPEGQTVWRESRATVAGKAIEATHGAGRDSGSSSHWLSEIRLDEGQHIDVELS